VCYTEVLTCLVVGIGGGKAHVTATHLKFFIHVHVLRFVMPKLMFLQFNFKFTFNRLKIQVQKF